MWKIVLKTAVNNYSPSPRSRTLACSHTTVRNPSLPFCLRIRNSCKYISSECFSHMFFVKITPILCFLLRQVRYNDNNDADVNLISCTGVGHVSDINGSGCSFTDCQHVEVDNFLTKLQLRTCQQIQRRRTKSRENARKRGTSYNYFFSKIHWNCDKIWFPDKRWNAACFLVSAERILSSSFHFILSNKLTDTTHNARNEQLEN